MDFPQVSSLEISLFSGILDANFDKVRHCLKELSPDTRIQSDVLVKLVANGAGQPLTLCGPDHNITLNSLTIPRVPVLLPLHLACICRNHQMVSLLLETGAQVNAALEDAETALHFACLYGAVDCVKKLINHGCDVNSQSRGDTPLLMTAACFGTTSLSQRPNYLEITSLLIEAECDVNTADLQGLAPLHLASGKEDPSLLKLFIQAGADVNIQAKAAVHPSTPLVGAVAAELEDNVKLLLEAGARVNQALYTGITALSTALDNNSLGIVLDLLEAGANPLFRIESLNVQMFMANKQYVLVLLLLSYGLDVNWQNSYDRASLLLSATRKASLPMMRTLMRLGADPDIDNCLGTTPLWAAVKLNHHALVSTLLRWNCDTDMSSLEYIPLIPLVPLQLAIQMGHFSIAKQLLYFGCLFKGRWLQLEPLASKLVENRPFCEWLQHWFSSPKSLQHLCMLTIRKQLGPGLPKRARKLGLPGRFKKYIITGDTF